MDVRKDMDDMDKDMDDMDDTERHGRQERRDVGTLAQALRWLLPATSVRRT